MFTANKKRILCSAYTKVNVQDIGIYTKVPTFWLFEKGHNTRNTRYVYQYAIWSTYHRGQYKIPDHLQIKKKKIFIIFRKYIPSCIILSIANLYKPIRNGIISKIDMPDVYIPWFFRENWFFNSPEQLLICSFGILQWPQRYMSCSH